MNNGEKAELVSPTEIRGTILQIVDTTSILLQVKGTSKLVAISMINTSGLTDDMRVIINAKYEGTYSYVSVLGAKKTIEKYRRCEPLKFEDFENLKANGVDLFTLTDKYLTKSKKGWK
jgi:predicted fused transcriptional regulator/phosphomethylpyrimidine kinase